jgi:hypothetical protein
MRKLNLKGIGTLLTRAQLKSVIGGGYDPNDPDCEYRYCDGSYCSGTWECIQTGKDSGTSDCVEALKKCNCQIRC